MNEKDVQRIVKALVADNDSDVPMMSDIADRVLYEVGRFLNLDQAAQLVVGIVVRISEILRGFEGRNYEPLPEPKFVNLFEEYPTAETPAEPTRRANLLRIRDVLSSMIEYIDQEEPQ